MLYCVSVWPWACRFGGTVNLKYCSAIFCGDDAFDTDEGYQGMGQFLFAMLGTVGNHGTEMDSKTNNNYNSMPRSHPAFYSMTIIGGGAGGRGGGLMRLREGTGGKFGNVILTNPTDIGLRIGDCGSETVTQTLPSASTSIGVAGDAITAGYLFFSSNNIISGMPVSGSLFTTDSSCSGSIVSWSAVSEDPALMSAHDLWSTYDVAQPGSVMPLDPRPMCGGSAFENVDSKPHGRW